MRRSRTVWFALSVLSCCLAHPSRAESLSAYASARTAGMGGAGTAASVGAASLHYNPALVAYEETLGAELALNAQYDGARLTPVPAFALNVPLGRTWTVGLSLAPGWALDPRTQLDEYTWQERRSAPWRTYDLFLSAMWAPDPQVGLSLSAGLTKGELSLRAGEQHANAGGWGASARLGFAARSDDERFTFGAAYRVTGPVSAQGELRGADTVLTLDTRSPVLHQASAGVDYRFNRSVTTTAQVDFSSWRALEGFSVRTADAEQVLVREAANGVALRLGADLAPTEYFRVRVGGQLEVPAPWSRRAPGGPALPLFGVTGGVGYTSGFFSFDFGAGVSFPHQSTPHLTATAAAGFRI